MFLVQTYTDACTQVAYVYVYIDVCTHCTDTFTLCTHKYVFTPCTRRASHAHTYVSTYVHALHVYIDLHGYGRMCSPGSYMQHKHTALGQVCAWHTCVLWGSVHTWSPAPHLLPGAWPGMSSVSLYLQGVDRSHSWVNSAYAPGGSKAVLRRVPPYCGADPRQVLSLPASTRVSPPLHEFFPPSCLQ